MSLQPQDRLTQAFILCNELDNERRKSGEKELSVLALDRNYPLYLLQYIMNQDQSIPPNFRVRAAIAFKKWTIDDWTKPSLQDIEFSEVHGEIKNSIVKVWIQQPKVEESLLKESLLVIAKWEFPQRWENLTQTLMSFLDPNQLNSFVNFRIFNLLGKITAKYEYSTRSDNLYREIILVADTTADYLLHFATALTTLLTQNLPNDAGLIKELLRLLKQVIKCFYFLNFQDMPEKFEANLNNWMKILSTVLTLDLQQLGEDIKMQVFKCKGESLRSILLFFTKYKEDVESLVQGFSQQIYQACMNISESDTSNKFVLNAMKYFKNLLNWDELKPFFASNMENLLQNLIFRMEKPTQDDAEDFESATDDFIENVLNNAGGSSRKNTVHDLAKALSKTYPQEVVPVLKQLIANYVQMFQGGQSDLVNEITLINILIDMGVSKFTSRMGVTELLLPAEFYTFFYESIVDPTLKRLFELVQNDANFNIDGLNLFHVSHLIRYVYFFRNFLDKGKLLEVIKNISFLVKTRHETFKKVLYHTIEGLIAIRDNMDIFAPSNFFYNKNNAYPNIQYILQNIYTDIKATTDLNPFVLKALFNLIKIMDDSSVQFLDAFCDLFKDMIQKLYKSYNFNTIFLVFDSLANFIISAKDNAQASQKVYQEIFPQLDTIIVSNNPDMLSYAFQIYALGIHFYNLPSDNAKLLFQSLMNLKNWEKDNGAMFPAYLMFIEELIVKQPDLLWSNLEIIQNIMSVVLIDNQQDQLFFTLASKIVIFFDLKILQDSRLLNTMLQIILRAIFESQNNIANKENNKPGVRGSLGKNVLLFWSLCIVKFTFEGFLQEVQNAFGNNFEVFYKFLIQEVAIIKQYQHQPERKVLLNGIESIVFSPLYEQLPQELWRTLLNAVVENIFRRRKHKLSSGLGDGYSNTVLTGFSSNFQKLSWFASQKLPYSELPDEDSRFVMEFRNKFANMAQQILEQVIDPKLQKFFQELFSQ